MAHQGIGASPLRREDARFITGHGQFVSDIDVAGQMHCAFVRSPHAHARITSIETSAALGMPGVHAVLTGADMACDAVAAMRALWPVTGVDGPAIEPPRFGLARGAVFHVGEAVALVIAASRAQAEDGAEQVRVEYAELPAVTTARAALSADAPQLHAAAPNNLCYRYLRGDRARTDADRKSVV